jgi:hypothetical protein
MKGFKKGYCKYCLKFVKLILDYDDDLVKCSKCDYGLAPLGSAQKYKSFNKWYEDIAFAFYIK